MPGVKREESTNRPVMDEPVYKNLFFTSPEPTCGRLSETRVRESRLAYIWCMGVFRAGPVRYYQVQPGLVSQDDFEADMTGVKLQGYPWNIQTCNRISGYTIQITNILVLLY
jgi:hypothetical protein